MKKLLVGVLALSALVACNKNEVIEQVASPAIQFENAFVDNATRAAADPSTTMENFTQFSVYGFMDSPAGVVFNEELVSKTGNDWSYVNTQYWTPGHDYYFAALAPVDGYTLDDTHATTEGVGIVSFENKDGKADLIYAEQKVELAADAVISANNPGKVQLTFNHLLSKIKFTFENGFDNANATVVVKDIKMVVPGAGSINLANAEWVWTNSGETTLDFGTTGKIAQDKQEECTTELLTIPAEADKEYKITFTAELYYGTILADTYEHEVTLTGSAFEHGKAYNICATLNANNIDENPLFPIEFNVEDVIDWVDGDVVAGGDILAAEVTDETSLVNAINAGQSVILENDITLTDVLKIGTLQVKSGDESDAPKTAPIFINLNGKTLNGAIKTEVDIVIENGKIADNGIYSVYKSSSVTVSALVHANSALVTLNNVNVTSNKHALLATSTDFDTVPNGEENASTGLIINGCEITSKCTTGAYALFTSGYNRVDIKSSKVTGYGAVRANSTKINVVDSDLIAKGNYYGIWMECCYVNYDINSTISSDVCNIYVQDCSYLNPAWTSSINGEVVVFKYITSSEAMKSAFENGGDNYVLVSNVTMTDFLTVAEGKNVVLDLNGKTLTLKANENFVGTENTRLTQYKGSITNNGTLTIKNGNIVYTEADGYSANAAIRNNNVLTLENVEVTSNAFAVRTNGTWTNGKTLDQQGAPTVKTTISGGSIKSTSTHSTTGATNVYAIYNVDNAMLTINNNAAIEGAGCVALNCSNAEVNGATFSTLEGKSGHYFYLISAANLTYANCNVEADDVVTYPGSSPKYGDITVNGVAK